MNQALNPAGSQVSLVPTSNVSLASYDDQTNPLRKIEGGAEAGMSEMNISKAYLQFKLPAFVPGTSVLSADLNSMYASDDQGSTGNLYVFSVSNSWNGATVLWENAPQEQAMLATLTFTPGQAFHADLTAYVDAAYKADGVVSVIIMHNPAVYSMGTYRTLSVDKRLDLVISNP